MMKNIFLTTISLFFFIKDSYPKTKTTLGNPILSPRNLKRLYNYTYRHLKIIGNKALIVYEDYFKTQCCIVS